MQVGVPIGSAAGQPDAGHVLRLMYARVRLEFAPVTDICPQLEYSSPSCSLRAE